MLAAGAVLAAAGLLGTPGAASAAPAPAAVSTATSLPGGITETVTVADDGPVTSSGCPAGGTCFDATASAASEHEATVTMKYDRGWPSLWTSEVKQSYRYNGKNVTWLGSVNQSGTAGHWGWVVSNVSITESSPQTGTSFVTTNVDAVFSDDVTGGFLNDNDSVDLYFRGNGVHNSSHNHVTVSCPVAC